MVLLLALLPIAVATLLLWCTRSTQARTRTYLTVLIAALLIVWFAVVVGTALGIHAPRS